MTKYIFHGFSSWLLVFFSLAINAEQLPQSFPYQDSKAVFVDLEKIKTQIKIDADSSSATLQSELLFSTNEEGYPLINLPSSAKISELKIESETLNQDQFTPATPNETVNWSLRALPKKLKVGQHKVKMTYTLNSLEHVLEFDQNRTVSLFTYMDDNKKLGENKNLGYAEVLFPSNLQYDMYAFEVDIEILNSRDSHHIKTNGQLSSKQENQFHISFPHNFSTYSFFIHLFPQTSLADANSVKRTIYKSIDGRDIKVETYCLKYPKHCEYEHGEVLKSLEAVEAKLGPYPFSELIVRSNSELHGMEYAGATIASDRNIRHEVVHMWYGRCVSPQSGRDGWIDEAIASWGDNLRGELSNFARNASAGFKGFNVNQYENLLVTKDMNSATHAKSYDQGILFLSKLDKIFENSGGIVPLLKKFFEENRFKKVTTEKFLGYFQSRPEWDERADRLVRILILGEDEKNPFPDH